MQMSRALNALPFALATVKHDFLWQMNEPQSMNPLIVWGLELDKPVQNQQRVFMQNY